MLRARQVALRARPLLQQRGLPRAVGSFDRALFCSKPEKVDVEQVDAKADADLDEASKQFMEMIKKEQAKREEGGTEKEEVVEEIKPEPTEKIVQGGSSQAHEFQAETRQLLNIVTNSLYTDKEVFVREIVSNASDALEKLRHLQVTGVEIETPELPLQISISCDPVARTLTITDTGVGMTKEDMISHLGTIARSGSKKFMQDLQEQGGGDGASEAVSGIIGQFGVGFYSAFMVSEKVEVFSKSATPDEPAHCWVSDGTGSYEIFEAEGVNRGSKMVMHLMPGSDASEFAEKMRIEGILQKYSNFVNFPIMLEGEAVNTVQAVWAKSKNEVTEQEYNDFYRFISHAFDEPLFRLHFSADAPLHLNTLFFVPSQHSEKYGMGRMEPGVSLYSRKVLIESKSPDVLPEWLRFVKGVVDSEDLPLSISREKMQDTRLIVKIRDILVRRLVKFFENNMQKEREEYNKFFAEFGQFLKEGVCTDFAHKDAIAKLLLFESSKLDKSELTSFDEYVARSPPTQDKIYFLLAPNRQTAEQSPYYETFKASGTEVLFVYTPLDDFVMSNTGKFNGRDLVAAESADVSVGDETSDKEGEEGEEKAATDDQKINAMMAWMKDTLGEKVLDVQTTTRLSDSPAIVVDHESAAMRRMMRMVQQSSNADADLPGLPPQNLLLNAKHPLVLKLSETYDKNPELCELVAEQVLENAVIAAGLQDDSRAMLPRINTILEKALEGGK